MHFKVLNQLHIVLNDDTTEDFFLPIVVNTTHVNSVIHKIISANLLPCTCGKSDMTYQDLILSSLILKGIKFNFVLMMIKHMTSCLQNKTKYFSYGSFITTILEHFQVSFEHEEFVSIKQVIDEDVFKNSKLGVGENGDLFWVSWDHTSAPPAFIPSTNHSNSPAPFVDSI